MDMFGVYEDALLVYMGPSMGNNWGLNMQTIHGICTLYQKNQSSVPFLYGVLEILDDPPSNIGQDSTDSLSM